MTDISQLAVLREREDHIEFKEAKHNYPGYGLHQAAHPAYPRKAL